MPGTFPNVKHCIVCEGVRPEAGGKATILGFFGFAPDVDILVPSLPAQLALTFMLVTGPGEGNSHVGKVILKGPDGKQLGDVSMPDIQFPPAGAAQKGLFVISFPNLPIVASGKHTLELNVDGNGVYTTTFMLKRDADLYKAVFGR